MTAIQSYLRTRDALVDVASRSAALLAEAQESLHLDLGPSLDKASQAQRALTEERLRVALLGDFSEGKTSLIAALTGRDDLETGVGPTTTEVQFYDHEGWTYADTPGLRSEKSEHDQRTTRWISEAHLILFLCHPENPLPAGQTRLLRWLYDTLQKGGETLFVIARIDALGHDLEDSVELDAELDIKREALRGALQGHLGRAIDPDVVTIAARPYGLSFSELWQDREGWMIRSRLPTLQRAIEGRLAGSEARLRTSAAAAALRDALQLALEPTGALVQEGQQTLNTLQQQIGELTRDIDRLLGMAREAHEAIRQELRTLRARLVESIEHAPDVAALRLLVERDLGEDGSLLDEEITSIVTRTGRGLEIEVAPVVVELQQEVIEEQGVLAAMSRRFVGPLLGQAAEALTAQSVRALSAGLLRLRDVIAPGIRFKPWGAVKLARTAQGLGTAINVFLAASPLLEIWDEVKVRQQRAALKKEVLAIIDTTRDELQWEPFLRQCVPALAELEASRALLVEELEALSERVEGAKKLQTRLRALHGELS